MTEYTVVAGDTLWKIAHEHQTTTDIIVADNDIITDVSLISVGWVLTIRTPDEVNEEKLNAAEDILVESEQLTEELLSENPFELTTADLPKVLWDGSEITPGQRGRVRILQPVPLVERLETPILNTLRMMEPPEMYRVFLHDTVNMKMNLDGELVNVTGLYNLDGNQWVTDDPAYVTFEPLPEAKKEEAEEPNVSARTQPTVESVAPTTPFFEHRPHPRPVSQIKKDGKVITMELRITGTYGSYTNQISANQTNAAWFLNLSGSTLPTKVINGYFLDTETNREFDEFLSNYRKYLKQYRDGDYLSSAICTLYYKGIEYKGLIAAFSYSDNTQETMIYQFSLQLLILKEKGPESGASKPPTVVTADKITGDDFYSDIRYLLLNPITGLYGTD